VTEIQYLNQLQPNNKVKGKDVDMVGLEVPRENAGGQIPLSNIWRVVYFTLAILIAMVVNAAKYES
jgi:hypothetical protein